MTILVQRLQGMPPRKPPAVDAYRRAREQADRVLDRTGLVPTRDAYEAETGRAVTLLGRLFRGQMKEKAAPNLERAAAALGQWATGMGERVGALFARSTRETFREGWDSSSHMLAALSEQRSPLTDALYLRVASRHLGELARLRQQSLQEVGRGVFGVTRAALARAVLVEPQLSVSDLITKAGTMVDVQSWRIERLVRTETSYAYNKAQEQALASVPRQFGAVWGRWTEYVDDLTGRPLDKRVGEDSLVLHAQIARPGGAFVMPPDSRAPTRMIGKSWTHPPNRPNDRSVLTPWMPGWAVKAWEWRHGRRNWIY